MNVLVALAWPNHVHHERAHRWFQQVAAEGWATSPLTESGFVRVSSNSKVIPDPQSPSAAIGLLKRMRALPGHVFWADDVSPTDPQAKAFARAVGYRQVTDAHLLTLADRNDGALATFDRGIAELAPTGRARIDLIP